MGEDGQRACLRTLRGGVRLSLNHECERQLDSISRYQFIPVKVMAPIRVLLTNDDGPPSRDSPFILGTLYSPER